VIVETGLFFLKKEPKTFALRGFLLVGGGKITSCLFETSFVERTVLKTA
jgi:hypothetical protein